MSLWRRIYVEHRRVLLPLIVFLIANVAILILAVLPLRQGVKSADEDERAAFLKLNEARLADRKAKENSTKQEQAKVELRKFYEDILPLDYPTARDLLYVWAQKTAVASRLQYKSGVLDFEEVKDSRLVKVFYKFALSGEYADVRKFLYSLETATEFVVVERVELAQSQLGTNTQGPLNLVVNVATYYQAAAPPSGGKTQGGAQGQGTR
jgi:Tfp pilus assembly protein PilO